MPKPLTSSEALLQQWKARRDEHAFGSLVQRHAGLVYNTCLRLTGDHHAAEDLTQDVFTDLARKAPRLKHSLLAYLHRSACNRSSNYLRAKRVRNRYWRAQIRQLASAQQQASESGEWELDETLCLLSEESRQIICLCVLEGRSQHEVADLMHINQATVSRRLSEAIQKLKGRLQGSACAVMAGGLVGQLHADAPPLVSRVPVPLRLQEHLKEIGGTVRPMPAMGLGVGAGGLLLVCALVFLFQLFQVPGVDRLRPDDPVWSSVQLIEDVEYPIAIEPTVADLAGTDAVHRNAQRAEKAEDYYCRKIWQKIRADYLKKGRGLSGPELTELLTETELSTLITAVRSNRSWLFDRVEGGMPCSGQGFPGDSRRRQLRNGYNDQPAIAIDLAAMELTECRKHADPLASGKEVLFFPRPESRAEAPVSLAAGRYEVIMGVMGSDSFHDALHIELGGQRLRAWGGWGEYDHFSHEPTIITVPETDVYNLRIGTTEELGVSLGSIHLVPLSPQGNSGQILGNG